jgi:hypothetical protein
MAKFKKGDLVRFIGGECDVEPGTICVIDIEGAVPYYHTLDGSHDCCTYERNFELMEKTMDNLEAGDVLVNKDFDYDLEVQGTIGKIVFAISTDYHTILSYSLDELKDLGWKLKDSTEQVELTVAELEDKLKMASGSLRIKK